MRSRPIQQSSDTTEPDGDHAIEVHLDEMLAKRDMTLTELSNRVGNTLANLSILKNGRARAIRFTTLTAICDVLDCQPGDILTITPQDQR